MDKWMIEKRHHARQIEQRLLGLVTFTVKALHEWEATIFTLSKSATVMKISTRFLGLPFNQQSCSYMLKSEKPSKKEVEKTFISTTCSAAARWMREFTFWYVGQYNYFIDHNCSLWFKTRLCKCRVTIRMLKHFGTN